MTEKIQAPKVPNLVYDVGMHKGEDSDYYLKKGFQVVGFEASPENAAHCRTRFADALERQQLTMIEGAIAERDYSSGERQTVKFWRNLDHDWWGSTQDDWASRNEVMGTRNELIEVPAVDFGRALRDHGIPYYLKADIVGSETICLRALLPFENKPDYLSIRSEKLIFKKLEYEFELLGQLGYDRFQAIQQSVASLRALHDSQEGKPLEHAFEEGASGLFGKDLRGPWKTREQVLKNYRRIFILYWLFGDYSYLLQTEKGRKLIAQLERVARRPLPGWYDTHARHSTVRAAPPISAASPPERRGLPDFRQSAAIGMRDTRSCCLALRFFSSSPPESRDIDPSVRA